MAVAWSWAFDTPFKFTKQIASQFGGTRQGMVMSWPGDIKDVGGIRNQFHHIIDIVPTILEATGVRPRAGRPGSSRSRSKVSAWPTPGTRRMQTRLRPVNTQYFEMIANRGIYHDGWYANTTPPHGPWILNAPLPSPTDYQWELYDLKDDYSQANDLAAKMPDKLKEMQGPWDQEAVKYNVLPLDNRSFARAVAPRPSATAGKTDFTYTGVNSGIALANAPNVLGKSYTITADVDVPTGGGDGVLATVGGRWGGWGFYHAEGQAGVQLQHAHSRPIPMGGARHHSPTRWAWQPIHSYDEMRVNLRSSS